MSGKNQKYSKEIKLKAVKMYIGGELSAIQIAKELELTDSGRVYKWVALYKEKGETAFDEETRGKKKRPGKGRQRTRFDSSEEKMKYLEM